MGNRQQAIGVRMGIRSYRDLLVWQRGMDLVELIYKITEKLPVGEQWGLTSQMRRASISVPANIAEGYGRQSSGNYKQFLSISRGSLLELETQVELCIRLKYLQKTDAELILNIIMEISKMLTSLISKLNNIKYCYLYFFCLLPIACLYGGS
jgi:four helix bundle protein